MREEALFINGVFESVLEEILEVQRELQEHVLFLQPHSSMAIQHLKEHPPTVDDPVRLFLSTTDRLSTVNHRAEIVGWEDKREMTEPRRNVISRRLWTLQPKETGRFDASGVEGASSVNLLHIRRLTKLEKPFEVSELVKTGDSTPVSAGRTTAGGWAYVRNRAEDDPPASR